MSKAKTILPVLLMIGAILTAPAAFAQTGEFSQSDLESFVQALAAIQGIQQDMQGEINEVVENGDLDADQFYQIHNQISQGTPTDNIPEDQLRIYQEVLNEVTTVEGEAQEKMVEAVEDQGISVDDYNTIITQAQSDPNLMAEIQQLMEG